MMKNSKVKLAFIGCGGMAGSHLNAYAEIKRKNIDIFDIVAVSDPILDRAQGFAKKISEWGSNPKVDVYPSFEEMLKYAKPDAVDICTPHFLHHVTAIAAMESGADAIIEKPLGVTIKAAKKMLETAQKEKKILATAEQVRRWLGPRTVKWAIHSGLIGKPRFFFAQNVGGAKFNPEELTYNSQITWRQDKITAGGGPIFDGGVHYADLLVYFFGEVDSVFAHTGNVVGVRYLSPGGGTANATVEDTSIATLKFKNGVMGTWNWTQVAPGKRLSYTVYYGSQGSIYSDGGYPTSPQLELWNGSQKDTKSLQEEFLSTINPDEKRRYFPPELFPELSNLKGDHGVELEVYDFLDAVIKRRRPELDGWDGLYAEAISIAFFESTVSGSAVKVDDVINGKVEVYQREINEKWGI